MNLGTYLLNQPEIGNTIGKAGITHMGIDTLDALMHWHRLLFFFHDHILLLAVSSL